MPRHIDEWLNAYLDGELHGRQLQHVEAHLAECPACQAELDSLVNLSSLLQEVPGPDFTPPERFAAQVRLRLPHRQRKAAAGPGILEIGWWMIPVGLLAAWVFAGTFFFMRDMLPAANSLGLLSSASNWMIFGSTANAYWSTTLGQFGILSGNTLDLAASMEVLTRTSLPQISLQVSIALLYLGWIAIWWVRYVHPGQDRPTVRNERN